MHVYLVAPLFHLVHHIQCDYHRPLQFHELNRKIEIALEVCRIDYVDYGVGLFYRDILPRHYLLHRIRGKGIYARQIYQRHIVAVGIEACVLYLAFLLLNRYAGPVAYVFPAARHGVEKRSLAAVWVAHKG